MRGWSQHNEWPQTEEDPRGDVLQVCLTHFFPPKNPSVCKGWSQCRRASIKDFWSTNREKTGHLPLSIVEQGGLNPDYGPSKMLCVCVCVCEGVFVSVACCQSVLGAIEKQQVSWATSGFDGYRSGRAAWRQRRTCLAPRNPHPARVHSPTVGDGFPAEEHDGEPPVRNGLRWWRRQRGGGHPLRSGQSCRDDPRGVWRVPETVGGGEVSNSTGCPTLS